MNSILLSSIIAILIPILVFIIAFILSSRSSQDREKSSAFECGFDPKSGARVPFSLRFFLLAVVFLVFDIEIALIIQLPKTLNNSLITLSSALTAILFLIILLIGLLHEWHEGSLNWT
uniref:NADH-ubiquinone oxidoreductase chain 3 n=3 Tax=Sternaspis TaxID=36132 RepID=A0A6C0UCB8_9ANNE|nr:NADH dehydrogenase subunit 3 [Sternaspis chinensis]YP_010580942.1 NADH dehydrogenase subunit 3 [Sternaspis liui]QIB72584.1 NADH dehydrogenase subunit 3 [Sternaspis scutata]UZT27140.1 NADH dehydrogenase subunit 3 [Sternaspis chinensis]UZT27153.1 NADH dehydrogenase subunit 3 [Sternaspis liui]